jgi:site-specific recombinase XerC
MKKTDEVLVGYLTRDELKPLLDAPGCRTPADTRDQAMLELAFAAGLRVILDPDTLKRRLLLCVYGLGTNAGLKRVSAGTDGVTHAELQHV